MEDQLEYCEQCDTKITDNRETNKRGALLCDRCQEIEDLEDKVRTYKMQNAIILITALAIGALVLIYLLERWLN